MADTMRASRLDPLWADYEAHHRTAGNKWCHSAGIPLILAGLLGLLSVPVLTVEGARVEAALLLIAVMAGLYLWLDWRLALALFVAGWILQFIGHGLYEKRSPAFFHNLSHLLVGPLWVLNHA